MFDCSPFSLQFMRKLISPFCPASRLVRLNRSNVSLLSNIFVAITNRANGSKSSVCSARAAVLPAGRMIFLIVLMLWPGLAFVVIKYIALNSL